MNTKLLMAIIVLFISSTGLASSFQSCLFDLKILAKTATELKVEVSKIVVPSGFRGPVEKLSCASQIKNKRIALDLVAEGKDLLTVGATLRAEWISYSAMTPNGPTSGVTWKFSEKN